VMDTAALSVITTFFIALMLVVGSISFVHDAEKNVLQPLQQITKMVQHMAEDPSKTIQETKNTVSKGQYEFDIIRATIIKIIALLRIGFGEAGFEMIKQNLSFSTDETTKKHNVTIDLLTNPGHPILAVFGFCIIEVT
jgi:hypothetical protein